MALVLSMLAAGPGLAEKLIDSNGPAELPPAGFDGGQFVDSNGCLFLRAGLNGTVTWVPRVNRQRELMCGYAPTFANAASPAAPKVKPAPKVVAASKPVAAAVSLPRTVSVPTPAAAIPRATTTARVPAGFRAAWSDGRLNPLRGPRTAAGDAQMARVWTNTVPARLVDPSR